MEKKSANQQLLVEDIRRYKTNGLGRMLALLGLVFNCLYIMLLYAFNDTGLYTIEMGVSVLVTLVYLLACFLSSEGVKAYNKKYSIVLIVLAVFQVVRIFGIPLNALNQRMLLTRIGGGVTKIGVGYFGMTLSQSAAFTILVLWLVLSAACLAGSAVISYLVCVKHEKYMKQLEDGEVDIDAVLKALDEEDAAAEAAKAEAMAAEQANAPVMDEVQAGEPVAETEVQAEEPAEPGEEPVKEDKDA